MLIFSSLLLYQPSLKIVTLCINLILYSTDVKWSDIGFAVGAAIKLISG